MNLLRSKHSSKGDINSQDHTVKEKQPCDDFKVQLTGDYKYCQCGFPRSEHNLDNIRRKSAAPSFINTYKRFSTGRLRAFSSVLPTSNNKRTSISSFLSPPKEDFESISLASEFAQDCRRKSILLESAGLPIPAELAAFGEVDINGDTIPGPGELEIVNESSNPSYACCAMKGRRPSMEDTFASHVVKKPDLEEKFSESDPCKSVLANASFFAVFDGHGGSDCSQYCAENMIQKVEDSLIECAQTKNSDSSGDETSTEDKTKTSKTKRKSKKSKSSKRVMEIPQLLEESAVRHAMESAFSAFDDSYCNQALEHGIEDGSTATIMFVRPCTHLIGTPKHNRKSTRKSKKEPKLTFEYFVACAGDSRALLIELDSETQLTVDHDPDQNPSERQRIEEKAGQRALYYDEEREIHRIVGRLGKRLGVTRAVGDLFFKPYVTAKPEITRGEFTTQSAINSYIILASDGLWGVISNKDVADFVREQVEAGKSPTEISTALTYLALKRGSDDNITVIVVDLAQIAANYESVL